MEFLTSSLFTQVFVGLLIFGAGFVAGTTMSERRNRRYRRILELM